MLLEGKRHTLGTELEGIFFEARLKNFLGIGQLMRIGEGEHAEVVGFEELLEFGSFGERFD
jgi:hypothetical protein